METKKNIVEENPVVISSASEIGGDVIRKRDAFAWREETDLEVRSEGAEELFLVPVDLQRDSVTRNGVEYDNFAVGCSFTTGKVDKDGNPVYLDVDFKVIPVETRTPVLYNLLKLIFGESKEKQLTIVKTIRNVTQNGQSKEIPSYSMRIVEPDSAIGEIFCDMRPQGTGDRVMFNILVNALKSKGYVK